MTSADANRPHGRLVETFVASPAELGGLRAVMRSWLSSQRVTEWDTNDILLAVGEAVSNAIEHAFHGGTPGRIEIDAVRDGGFIVIRIRDNGRWRSEPAPGDRGRGLPLMRKVTRVDIRTSPSGTTVTLRRRLEGE